MINVIRILVEGGVNELWRFGFGLVGLIWKGHGHILDQFHLKSLAFQKLYIFIYDQIF